MGCGAVAMGVWGGAEAELMGMKCYFISIAREIERAMMLTRCVDTELTMDIRIRNALYEENRR